MTSTDIHWSILGAGSIGCLWAAYLARSEQNVTLILKNQAALDCWQQHKTIQLESQNATVNIENCEAELAHHSNPIHHLLVTTKAHQTIEAIQSIRHRLQANSIIVLMQNGLGVLEELSNVVPNSLLLSASTTEGAYQKEPFHVVHAGKGKTHIGYFQQSSAKTQPSTKTQLNPEIQAAILAIKNSFDKTSLSVEIDLAIAKRLWHKLAINCAINGLTVIHQCQNGNLLQIPEAMNQMQEICKEVAEVFKASGVTNEDNLAVELFNAAKDVANKTAQNYSSMLQDNLKGRPTEINYINGYVVKKAQEFGIPCTCNQMIIDQVKARTKTA